jgi:hypothetical protein
MKMLVLSAALVTLIASPAFAQAYPDGGVSRLNGWQRDGRLNARQGRAGRNPYNTYARTPYDDIRSGRRSPYAQYDQNGKLIDQNMPGRW